MKIRIEIPGNGIDIRLYGVRGMGVGSRIIRRGIVRKEKGKRGKKENQNIIRNIFIRISIGIIYRGCKLSPREGGIHRGDKFQYTYREDKVIIRVRIRFIVWTRVMKVGIKGEDKEGVVIEYEYILIGWFGSIGRIRIRYTNTRRRIYMCRECISLCIYMIAGYIRNSGYSTEAGLKYYRVGGRGSTRIRYGRNRLYGSIGGRNRGDVRVLISGYVKEVKGESIRERRDVRGWEIRIGGFRRKMGGAPFHRWRAEVYEGGPRYSVFYYAIIPKRGRIRIRTRRYRYGGSVRAERNIERRRGVSLRSIRVGSRGGRVQVRIKGFMAYSSIGHVGWMRGGLSIRNREGIEGIRFYRRVYTRMSMRAWKFIVRRKVKEKNGEKREVKYRTDRYKRGEENPIGGGIRIRRFISMAGIPPRRGFGSKMILVIGWIEGGRYIMSRRGLRFSVIGGYNYIRRIKRIYFENKEGKVNVERRRTKPIARRISVEIIRRSIRMRKPGPFIRLVHNMGMGRIYI